MTALILVVSILLSSKVGDGHPVPQQAGAGGQLTATPAGALSQMVVNLLNYKLQWLSQFTGAIPGAAAPGIPCPPLFGAGTTPPAEEPPVGEEGATEEPPADEEIPIDDEESPPEGEAPPEEEPAPEEGAETTTAAPVNGLDAL